MLFSISLAATVAAATPAFQGACAPLNDIKFSTSPNFETQSYRFPSGPIELEGCLFHPIGKTNYPIVVAVSGSDERQTAADVYAMIHAKAFAARGIGVFAFNKRGYGASGGTRTSTDFLQRAYDVASAVRFARTLDPTAKIGLWGTSQAGWVIPRALRQGDGVEAVMLTSPSGVSPFEQVAYYIRGLAKDLGMTDQEADKAERVHRVTAKYYASGRGYGAAQAQVSRYAGEPWFEKFRTNESWNEKIGPGGQLLKPAELRTAWRTRADDFEFYRSASTFADYTSDYALLDRPTLIVNGSADSLIPTQKSTSAIKGAIKPGYRTLVEFKDFEGAEHGIQDGPRVRQAYLDYIGQWAADHLLK